MVWFVFCGYWLFDIRGICMCSLLGKVCGFIFFYVGMSWIRFDGLVFGVF